MGDGQKVQSSGYTARINSGDLLYITGPEDNNTVLCALTPADLASLASTNHTLKYLKKKIV